MGVGLKRSYVSREAVNNQIRRSFELFRSEMNRNPTAKEKRRIELKIIQGAEQVNRERKSE